MAVTQFAKTHALTQKLWSATLFKEAMREIYVSKFMGEGADNIIQRKDDLTKEKGDKITVGLRMAMTGAGQSSQTGITLEGNEEALVYYDFAVELSEYGHAVKAGSKLDIQRPAFDLRTDMKDALKDWLSEKIEKLLIVALVASPTTNHRIYKSGSGGSNLSAALISQAKRMAQLATPKVRPVNVPKYGTFYVMLVHPYASKALKADSDWRNAQLQAAIRGADNPIFTGALGVYDGVVVHEYDRSNLILSGNVAINLLLGAQAGVVAYAQYPAWYEKLFDYDRIPGVATDFLSGIGKSVFNSEDFATIYLRTNYTPDT